MNVQSEAEGLSAWFSDIDDDGGGGVDMKGASAVGETTNSAAPDSKQCSGVAATTGQQCKVTYGDRFKQGRFTCASNLGRSPYCGHHQGQHEGKPPPPHNADNSPAGEGMSDTGGAAADKCAQDATAGEGAHGDGEQPMDLDNRDPDAGLSSPYIWNVWCNGAVDAETVYGSSNKRVQDLRCKCGDFMHKSVDKAGNEVSVPGSLLWRQRGNVPCSHVVAVCSYLGLSYESMIDTSRELKTVIKAYGGPEVLPGHNAMRSAAPDQLARLPPLKTTKAARKKHRMHEGDVAKQQRNVASKADWRKRLRSQKTSAGKPGNRDVRKLLRFIDGSDEDGSCTTSGDESAAQTAHGVPQGAGAGTGGESSWAFATATSAQLRQFLAGLTMEEVAPLLERISSEGLTPAQETRVYLAVDRALRPDDRQATHRRDGPKETVDLTQSSDSADGQPSGAEDANDGRTTHAGLGRSGDQVVLLRKREWDILYAGGMLTDEHLHLFQLMLQKQYPHLKGLVPPSR